MSIRDNINISVLKFWALILLIAILSLSVGFILGRDSNQAPIIIEQGNQEASE